LLVRGIYVDVFEDDKPAYLLQLVDDTVREAPLDDRGYGWLLEILRRWGEIFLAKYSVELAPKTEWRSSYGAHRYEQWHPALRGVEGLHAEHDWRERRLLLALATDQEIMALIVETGEGRAFLARERGSGIVQTAVSRLKPSYNWPGEDGNEPLHPMGSI